MLFSMLHAFAFPARRFSLGRRHLGAAQYFNLMLVAAISQIAWIWPVGQALADSFLQIVPLEDKYEPPPLKSVIASIPAEEGARRFTICNRVKVSQPKRLVYMRVSDIFVGESEPRPPVTASEPTSYLVGLNRGDIRQMDSDELEQRGRELRNELQQVYQKLIQSKKLSGGGTDVTDSVQPYFPAGLSFDEAETLLRSAGFIVEPHPDLNQAANPNRAKDWYAVTARISPLVASFPIKVSVYISLVPKSPGDYTTVASVSAKLFASSP